MSSIGPLNFGAFGPGFSAAAALRNSTDQDRVLANRSQQQHQHDEVLIADRDLAEKGDADGQVADRDGDGRLPWETPQRQPANDTDATPDVPASTRTAEDEGMLDLCV